MIFTIFHMCVVLKIVRLSRTPKSLIYSMASVQDIIGRDSTIRTLIRQLGRGPFVAVSRSWCSAARSLPLTLPEQDQLVKAILNDPARAQPLVDNLRYYALTHVRLDSGDLKGSMHEHLVDMVSDT